MNMQELKSMGEYLILESLFFYISFIYQVENI